MMRILFAALAASACMMMSGCSQENDEDAIEKANDAEFRKMPPHEKDLGEFKEEVTFPDSPDSGKKVPKKASKSSSEK